MTMTTTTATSTVRLNATLELAPASVGRWAVTKVRKFQSLDGGGFEATVTLDGKVVGTFANEGNGGGTWFRHSSREARDAMESLSREWAQIQPDLVYAPTVTVNADGSQSEPEALVSEEHICDSLVENANLAKKLDGIVKRGKTPVLTRKDAADADNGGEWHVEYGIKGYGTINGPLDVAGVRALIARDDLLVWASGEWSEVAGR